MKAIQSIIVGTDFSENSVTALRQAIHIAHAYKATLHVVHIVGNDTLELCETHRSITREQLCHKAYIECNETLDHLVTPDQRHDFGIKVDIEVGNAIEVIKQKIKDTSSELVVIGMHGHSSRGSSIGVFTTRAIRELPAEVLVVHEDCNEPYKKVVACVDFSENTHRIIDQAIHLPDVTNLELLHIYDEPWNRINYLFPSPQINESIAVDYRKEITHEMENTLKPFSDELSRISHQDHMVLNTNHAFGIIDFLNLNAPDLLVLGTHGISGPLGPFIGSTAERVLSHTPCSVLTIKPMELSF